MINYAADKFFDPVYPLRYFAIFSFPLLLEVWYCVDSERRALVVSPLPVHALIFLHPRSYTRSVLVSREFVDVPPVIHSNGMRPLVFGLPRAIPPISPFLESNG